MQPRAGARLHLLVAGVDEPDVHHASTRRRGTVRYVEPVDDLGRRQPVQHRELVGAAHGVLPRCGTTNVLPPLTMFGQLDALNRNADATTMSTAHVTGDHRRRALARGREASPSAFVVVHEPGGVAEQIRGVIDELRGGVEAPWRDTRSVEVSAERSRRELDVIDHIDGAEEQLSGEGADVGGLPVVGDDAMALAEEIGELWNLQECRRDAPGRLHRGSYVPVASASSAIARMSRMRRLISAVRPHSMKSTPSSCSAAPSFRSSAPSTGLNGVAHSAE